MVITMDVILALQNFMTIVGGLITLLTIIAPLTPSKWDDKILISLKALWNGVKISDKDSTVLITVKKD